MKNIVVIIVVILLLAGGFLYWQNTGGVGVGKYQMANVLPQDPMLYVEMKNTRANIDKFTETLFWDSFSKIDYDLMLSSNQLNPREQVFFKMLKGFFENPQENEAFNKFFGKDVAIAVYLPDIDFNIFNAGDPNAVQDLIEEVTSNIYLVSRLDATAKLAEFLSRSFSEFGAEVTSEEVDYKDHLIKLLSIKDVPYKLAYTRLKDLMVVGVGRRSIEKSIDIYLGKKTALISDERFDMASKKVIKNSDAFTYVNMESFVNAVEKQVISASEIRGMDSEQIRLQMEKSFGSMRGFKSVGISTAWPDLLQSRLSLIFNRDQMESGLARFYDRCKNTGNQSLKFIPENMIAYQWANCFDLEYYWDELKGEMERTAAVSGQPSVPQQIAQYEQMIGMTIEGDVIPAFGQEIGGYIKDIHVDQSFPVPELLIYIKINNLEKAERLIGLLKGSPMVMFQNENYNGIDLNFVNIPVAEYVSPGYCFLNDYLLVSVNKDLLKSSIDVAKNGAASIESNSSFKLVNKGLTSKNIGVQFLKMDEIAFKLSSIIDWSTNFADARNQKQEAFKAGTEMRLKQVQKEIEADDKVLKGLDGDIAALEGEVVTIESSGGDASAKKQEIQDKKVQVENIKADIEERIDNAIQMQDMIKGYDSRSLTTDKRSLYMKGIVYPIIDSLKTIDGVGSVSTMFEDSLETDIFINL